MKFIKDSLVLHKSIVFISKSFPKDFYYLKDQICRASLSIVLNIAEGSGKSSDKDFNRYLNNSLGSVNETMSCIEVALMEGLIRKDKYVEIEKFIIDIKNQLGGFSKRLKG